MKTPECPECGTALELVDCEQRYPVLRGDSEKLVAIPETWYCELCQTGQEIHDDEMR